MVHLLVMSDATYVYSMNGWDTLDFNILVKFLSFGVNPSTEASIIKM